MELFAHFRLNITSLLFFNLLPLSYFAVHRNYWYRPDILRRFDLLLNAVCILLTILVSARVIASQAYAREQMILSLLHLMPLAFTLIAVSWFRIVRKEIEKGLPGRKEKVEVQTGYDPIPMNMSVEKLGWNDLIIDAALREELTSVISLLKDPSTAVRYGIQVPRGILLDGPPGTGKTTVAKVIASTASLSFFPLRMDEVVSKWVGDSEKNLSKLFRAAQQHAPSVIFIDEVDSVGHGRSMGGQQWAENLLNHLLQLIDGVIRTEGLYIIAATNRADLVDPALRRAGRLNRVIQVPLPGFDSRVKLFALHLSKLKLEQDVDLNLLSTLTEGRSGADVREICNRAGLNAFKRESAAGKRVYTVKREDLEKALREFLGV